VLNLSSRQIEALRHWALPAEERHTATAPNPGRAETGRSLERLGLLTSQSDDPADPCQLTQKGWRELRRREVLNDQTRSENVVDEVGRDLVDAIRSVLGSAGIWLGRPGLVDGELLRRLRRDHAAEAAKLDDLSFADFIDILQRLTGAGIIAQIPARSSAGPRFLLPGETPTT
jgi:hypothetical protein